MNRVRGRMGALGASRALATSSTTKALTKHERRRTGVSTAGSATMGVGGAIAAIPVPPWTQIIGAGAVVIGGALKLGAALGTRGTKALSGDRSAIKGYARRAARWSSKKRARKAGRLLKRYQRLSKTRRASKGRTSITKRLAILKMKMELLYALEARARRHKGGSSSRRSKSRVKRPGTSSGPMVLTKGDAEEPLIADVPAGPDTATMALWAGGALVGALVIGLALRRSRSRA